MNALSGERVIPAVTWPDRVRLTDHLPHGEVLLELAESWACPRWSWDEHPSGDRVYFVACNLEFVKIGTTGILSERLTALRTGNPYPLSVLALLCGDRRLERALQREFAEQQHGREWFRLEGRLRHFLDRLEIAAGERDRERLGYVAARVLGAA